MAKFHSGRRPGQREMMRDLLSIVLMLVIGFMAVLIFFLRDTYRGLIPVVFGLGVVLNGVNAWNCWSFRERRKRNVPGMVISLIFMGILLASCILSAIGTGN